MRTYTYPDGTLELRSSGAVTGPDQVGGQHYGTSYLYARLNDGPWHPVTSRSLHSASVLCGAAENGAEALKAITEADG